MKMKVTIKKKEQIVDVDFWDFFKGFILSYALATAILFVIGFMIGLSWAMG